MAARALLGFSGKCRSGKNTAAEAAGEWFRARGWTVHFVAFADPLRAVLETLTGVPASETHSAENKARLLPPAWGGLTVGRALQTLATDAIRHHFHPDAWIIAGLHSFDSAPASDTKTVWIFTDVRFPNEAGAIRDRGGLLIRIERLVRNVSAETRDLNHISEIALDGFPHFAARIDNDQDLATLSSRISESLDRLM